MRLQRVSKEILLVSRKHCVLAKYTVMSDEVQFDPKSGKIFLVETEVVQLGVFQI